MALRKINSNYSADYWQKTKAWADRFTPAAKRILGEYLISDSSFDDDMKKGFDLEVKSATFALRVRKHSYFANPRTRGDITIRTSCNATETEIDKLKTGRCADYYFLGYAAKEGADLAEWVILDTRKLADFLVKHEADYQPIRSSANGTSFICINVRDLPGEAIFAASEGLSWS
ncbi:hypothetical protein [Puniceicoccus vermicola]|uniref:Uncharacterized protein n=1 Tax=Puniceicoccus vermicola TaxID=388746 RepID=A0A7X1AY27_9BACT|nr:hypothetical protein [Puniceicoccus vermicola]MBC2602067.1 hypothetical protein [Puniceicoccus vermicola]